MAASDVDPSSFPSSVESSNRADASSVLQHPNGGQVKGTRNNRLPRMHAWDPLPDLSHSLDILLASMQIYIVGVAHVSRKVIA